MYKPKSESMKGLTKHQWLEKRTEGIGGSDVAAVLGLSPWKSPYSVWAEKTRQVPIDDAGNEFTHWGTIMEPILAREFEAQTGKRVYRQNKTFYDPKHPYLRADIDRDVAGEPGFLEIKTAMEYKSQEWADGNVPIPYQLQVQHYMYVLDRPYVYFAYLIGGHKFGWRRVDRDQEAIDTVEPLLINWWEKHVIKGEPPLVDGSEATTNALRALYPEDDGEVVPLKEDFNSLIKSRDQLKETGKQTKEAMTEIDNQLRAAIGEATAGETTQYLITNKVNKRGNRALHIKQKKQEE